MRAGIDVGAQDVGSHDSLPRSAVSASRLIYGEHRDLRQLMVYYKATAPEIASKLDLQIVRLQSRFRI